jgi:hypothetical protein
VWHPTGWGILQTWSRHLSDQWSTISSGKPCWSLYIHETLRWSMNIISHSLCLVILDLVWGQITDISILCSPLLPTSVFTRSHDIASFMTKSHACKLRRCKCHRVGLEYQSVTRIDKSRSWCTRLHIPIGIPKRHLFSHPVKVMTVDAIKAAFGCSD